VSNLQKPKASNQSINQACRSTIKQRNFEEKIQEHEVSNLVAIKAHGEGMGGGAPGGGGADRTGGLIHPSNHGISKKEFREHEVFNLPQSKGGTQMRAR